MLKGDPSQHDLHNAVNFLKTSIWRRPTHSHCSSSIWLDRGQPMTAKTHSIIGPLQLFVILREIQAFQSECNSQRPLLCLQHECISWSLKVKLKKINCWCPDPILSFALHPFPLFPKPLLELVHRITKSWIEAKNELPSFPPPHHAFLHKIWAKRKTS